MFQNERYSTESSSRASREHVESFHGFLEAGERDPVIFHDFDQLGVIYACFCEELGQETTVAHENSQR